MTEVAIKSGKGGVDLILPEEGTFQEALVQAKWRLCENKAFFDGGKISINLKGRAISEVEAVALKKEIRAILDNTYVVFDACEPQAEVLLDRFLEKGETIAVLRRGTVRSGERVDSRGSIVVYGNVNPGAELVAEGDIVVLGSMRGVAHAGCKGDASAMVSALCLSPTQIRIADIFTCPPEQDETVPTKPEVAFISKNKIYIHEI